MTTTLPTADQVIPLYDKYHIDWIEGEYIDGMFSPRACASGICLIDRLGSRELAEELIDLDDDNDITERIAQVLNWPDPFLIGVFYGNDGDSFETLQKHPWYQGAADQDQALYHQGYELGRAVRAAFYGPPEDDDDDDEGDW
jgi:hypothetical protein